MAAELEASKCSPYLYYQDACDESKAIPTCLDQIQSNYHILMSPDRVLTGSYRLLTLNLEQELVCIALEPRAA
jgi:hypothetical protein